jgi:ribonuclease Z
MRWIGAVAVGSLVLGGVLFTSSATLSRFVFDRMAERAVARDLREELPDGLHAFLCGSGSPMPDPGRAGPCIGVLAGKRAFIFDAGAGGARRLARMGFPMSALETVYLTHLHSDHFDGLGELMLQAWIGGARAAPLPIAGPQGVEEVVGGFVDAYRIDSTYRIAHHGAAVADPKGYGAVPIVLAPPAPGPDAARVILSDQGVTITLIRVSHPPVDPAFGYRIDYKGRSVVISGDTVRSESLVRASKGADVLFHEALQPEMMRTLAAVADDRRATALSQVLTDVLDYHASPVDAAHVAREAGVGLLVMHHIAPPLPVPFFNAAYMDGVQAIIGNRAIVGSDGLLISLPSGASRIDRRKIL